MLVGGAPGRMSRWGEVVLGEEGEGEETAGERGTRSRKHVGGGGMLGRRNYAMGEEPKRMRHVGRERGTWKEGLAVAVHRGRERVEFSEAGWGLQKL